MGKWQIPCPIPCETPAGEWEERLKPLGEEIPVAGTCPGLPEASRGRRAHKRAARSQPGAAGAEPREPSQKIPREWHLLQTGKLSRKSARLFWNLLLHVCSACKTPTETTEGNVKIFAECQVKFINLKYFIRPFIDSLSHESSKT